MRHGSTPMFRHPVTAASDHATDRMDNHDGDAMHDAPEHMGAPGHSPTPSRDDGHRCADDPEATRMAMSGPGTRQGLGSPNIPEHIRAGAFQPDLSVEEYSGRPGDSGGHVMEPKRGNKVPEPSVKRYSHPT